MSNNGSQEEHSPSRINHTPIQMNLDIFVTFSIVIPGERDTRKAEIDKARGIHEVPKTPFA